MEDKTDVVWFTSKGQVVVPSWLRKHFGIEEGTRAVVSATTEGILLRPVTPATIKRVRGFLKGQEAATDRQKGRG